MPNVINATSTGNGGLITQGDDSGILNIQTNETTAITVDASQIVTLSSASNPSLIVNRTASTGDAGLSFQSTGTGVSSLTGLYGGGLRFGTGSGDTERMRIDSSGNLLVGTTSSDIAAVGIRLMNNNQLQASKSGDWSFRMGRRDSTGIITEIYYNSSRVGDISTNGSNTTYNSASDYRLKENVQPMVGALDKISVLKPVTYKWKINGFDGQGFIAHELQNVVPDAVRGEKDELDVDGNPVYQSIDTSVLVATLTAAIQELKTIVDTQAETINALTARIVALEGQ